MLYKYVTMHWAFQFTRVTVYNIYLCTIYKSLSLLINHYFKHLYANIFIYVWCANICKCTHTYI